MQRAQHAPVTSAPSSTAHTSELDTRIQEMTARFAEQQALMAQRLKCKISFF